MFAVMKDKGKVTQRLPEVLVIEKLLPTLRMLRSNANDHSVARAALDLESELSDRAEKAKKAAA